MLKRGRSEKWSNYYILGESNIGAKAKVAIPCLYSTKTINCI